MTIVRQHPRGRRRTSAKALRVFAVLVVAFVAGFGGIFFPAVADAQGHDAGEETGTASDGEAGADDDAAVDPTITQLREMTRQIHELMAERLAADVAPQTLFDVAIDDGSAINLETVRLRTLLREVDAQAGRREAGAKRPARDAGGADAATIDVSPSLWRARTDLDRARLSFYSLPTPRRHELLAAHAKRSVDASTPSEDEQRAREAEAQRAQALRAARDARSEAERLVSEEYARLLGVEREQAAFERKLAAQRQAIASEREATLGWQRRAREARGPQAQPNAADETYDELRKALRAARDDLDRAIDEASKGASDVPNPGADPLVDLQTSVDTKAAREERKRVDTAAQRLSAEEKTLHDERASQLLDEIDALNSERLALLPFLSASKRTSITGFTAAGLDQAASEVRQLTLIARYHRYAATAWITSLRNGGHGLGLSVGGAVLVAVYWFVAVGAFFWVRRRTPLALQRLRKRAQSRDRHEHLDSPSLATRGAAFAIKVQRPVEWLGLALLLSWLLPSSAQGLLEVQLVTVIVEWVLGGALVVVIVNALADAENGALLHEDGASALRLRSLRLVGRVVVGFGLVLVLTSRLVGPGTIYQWVLSTCWLASIPVFLVLVRWWRDVVFERAERTRKKTAFEQWVLQNRVGWKSFLAATGGGVYLFTRGAFRAGRGWISRFNVTRSVLAYLFRRELGKLEAERMELVTARISDGAFEVLGPETHGQARVATDVDEEMERLADRLRERRGGVVAIVAPFGMGKSGLLRQLHDMFPDTLLMTAPDEGEDAMRVAFGGRVGLAHEASLDEAAGALAGSSKGRALLLDDAHRFVRPVMGGLSTFDALLAAASRNSAKTTWIFALDEIIWLFLQRARGARPLFDEVIRLRPWREEQIIELLRARTKVAGLDPSFERLLEKLPPNADEIDKHEALERRAASYYRLLWDYAAGNPGIALHMWRRSLGADPDGSTHVRFFQAPDGADLELLPDQAVFVLRAVLQMAPATLSDIAEATMLRAPDITDALRYAEARTYLINEAGRYRITWTWHRAITLFLQRRHLLVVQ